jgi:hypothetical protein
MCDHPIDIVVPWVDGDDPAWRAERAKFRPGQGADNNEARFREWGLFQYWFRSIERYAPWVRTVHLITWGHLPPWLDTSHPKLHIVRHQDYIPGEYLPTFSSVPIENNVHRIEGLAEHFILFNDDVYLTRPTTPEDFFVDGLPVDTAVLGNVTISDTVSFMPYLALNCLGIVNERFRKREVMKAHAKKWFTLKYGKLALFNLYFLPGTTFPGFRSFHTCLPYRKSTFREVWEAYPEAMDLTCRNRFRDRRDINQYVFRYWRLAKGEFAPAAPNCTWLTIGQDHAETVREALYSKRYKVVCVNDDPSGSDFPEEQKRFCQIFSQRFPDRCGFELP